MSISEFFEDLKDACEDAKAEGAKLEARRKKNGKR